MERRKGGGGRWNLFSNTPSGISHSWAWHFKLTLNVCFFTFCHFCHKWTKFYFIDKPLMHKMQKTTLKQVLSNWSFCKTNSWNLVIFFFENNMLNPKSTWSSKTSQWKDLEVIKGYKLIRLYIRVCTTWLTYCPDGLSYNVLIKVPRVSF